ncbi:hypothetical protein L228DRAFT_257952 [Xylona heveae TC161]|uniref:Uncharacterized protein n=1 Tax=Xylona heveae (strain CBS 132557 / TC161) TaxID=1328760 RepID=A0A165JR82_XYLHT|nr:hypothetical protein L228DRAFT_257952 [Xylona heveae TC161]KZF26535.1 hypothetical protein L228DRAFT_257952 [Xylona heveae TC161]
MSTPTSSVAMPSTSSTPSHMTSSTLKSCKWYCDRLSGPNALIGSGGPRDVLVSTNRTSGPNADPYSTHPKFQRCQTRFVAILTSYETLKIAPGGTSRRCVLNAHACRSLMVDEDMLLDAIVVSGWECMTDGSWGGAKPKAKASEGPVIQSDAIRFFCAVFSGGRSKKPPQPNAPGRGTDQQHAALLAIIVVVWSQSLSLFPPPLRTVSVRLVLV